MQTLRVRGLRNKHSNKHKSAGLLSIVINTGMARKITIPINTSRKLTQIRILTGSRTISHSTNVRRIYRGLPNTKEIRFVNIGRRRLGTPKSTKNVTDTTAGNKKAIHPILNLRLQTKLRNSNGKTRIGINIKGIHNINLNSRRETLFDNITKQVGRVGDRQKTAVTLNTSTSQSTNRVITWIRTRSAFK